MCWYVWKDIYFVKTECDLPYSIKRLRATWIFRKSSSLVVNSQYYKSPPPPPQKKHSTILLSYEYVVWCWYNFYLDRNIIKIVSIFLNEYINRYQKIKLLTDVAGKIVISPCLECVVVAI